MTIDEAMFNLGGSYSRRRVCYIRNGHGDPSQLKCVKSDSFAPGFLVTDVISFYGKTRYGSSLKGQGQFAILCWQRFETIH